MNRADYLIAAKSKRQTEWQGFTMTEQDTAKKNLAIDLGTPKITEAMMQKASIMKLLLASARRIRRTVPTKEMLQRKIEHLLKWAEKYGFKINVTIQ